MAAAKRYPDGLNSHTTAWLFSGNSTLLACGCGWDSRWTTPDRAAKRWRKHLRRL